MFKTTIDSKPIKVTFAHQKAAWNGQLTRPDIRGKGIGSHIARVPIFANTFCFFDEVCVGVAFCSYADEGRYSKEIGRRVSLKNALHTTLKRSGKSDSIVASERAQVWEDYFRAGTRANKVNPLVIGRSLHRMASEVGLLTEIHELGTIKLDRPGAPVSEVGLLTDIPVPFPTDRDMNHTTPWRLGGMTPEVIEHLNNEDRN